MRRKQAAVKTVRARARAQPRAPLSYTVLMPLLLDLFASLRGNLSEYGIPVQVQDALYAQSPRARGAKHASRQVLKQYQGLADLLSAWREEAKYLKADGKPRVLTIKGRGLSFSGLARKYLPGMPLIEVLAIACRHARVQRVSGGRLALLGDTVVNISSTREGALAQAIAHMNHLFGTGIHNLKAERKGDQPKRLERVVERRISRAQFDKFLRANRPLVHGTCEHVDGQLKAGAAEGSRSGKEMGTGGMGVYVYFDPEPRPQTKRRKRRRQP